MISFRNETIKRRRSVFEVDHSIRVDKRSRIASKISQRCVGGSGKVCKDRDGHTIDVTNFRRLSYDHDTHNRRKFSAEEAIFC